jgi:hypothetical protein
LITTYAYGYASGLEEESGDTLYTTLFAVDRQNCSRIVASSGMDAPLL